MVGCFYGSEYYIPSKHIMDARVRELGEQNWVRFTEVYGTSYMAEKEEFWGWMSSHFSLSTIPWLCGRDFNEFIWECEKSGGHGVFSQTKVLGAFYELYGSVGCQFQGAGLHLAWYSEWDFHSRSIDRGFSIVIGKSCGLILLQYMLQCWALTIAQSLFKGSRTFRKARRDFVSRPFGQMRKNVGNQ